MNSNILFILDGKMAKIIPSKKNIKPIAINTSFTNIKNVYFLREGLIDFPKNLKKSLSGDSTSDVSPPINAFS